MAGDRLRPLRRTTWKPSHDGVGKRSLEHDVVVYPTLTFTFGSPGPDIGIGETFGLGLLQRRLLDEHTLALTDRGDGLRRGGEVVGRWGGQTRPA